MVYVSVERYYCPLEWWYIGREILLSSLMVVYRSSDIIVLLNGGISVERYY